MNGYGIDHLPYGVYSAAGHGPRVGVRFGDAVIDAHRATGLDEMLTGSLNAFLALGPEQWSQARSSIAAAAEDAESIPLDEVTLHLPFDVADYVDFYCSLQHATNVGRIFRPDSEPLTPNWRHLPIGYHGRAGTVVVSGTDVVRPCGQRPESAVVRRRTVRVAGSTSRPSSASSSASRASRARRSRPAPSPTTCSA